MKEIITYLTFDGNAREAMSFYAEALGGKLDIMTAGDSGQPSSSDEADRVMHARHHGLGHLQAHADALPAGQQLLAQP